MFNFSATCSIASMSGEGPGEWRHTYALVLILQWNAGSILQWNAGLLRNGVSVCLLAKPFHNLALRVFQWYYAELCEALSSSPKEVAAVLFSNGLVTRQESSQVSIGSPATDQIWKSAYFDASRWEENCGWVKFYPTEEILPCVEETAWCGKHCIKDEIPARWGDEIVVHWLIYCNSVT